MPGRDEEDPNVQSALPPDLIAAYRATDFRVLDPQSFTLRVDLFSPELQRIHADLQVFTSGFLTAWNPWSAEMPREANDQAQEALRVRLVGMGLEAWAGLGVDPEGRWPGEESWFIPGLSRRDAIALGGAFHQNAVVWAGRDAIPRLILLR